MGLWPFISRAYRLSWLAKDNYCEKLANKINLKRGLRTKPRLYSKGSVYWDNKEGYYFALIFLKGCGDFCYMDYLSGKVAVGFFPPSYLVVGIVRFFCDAM